ncbi:Domain of uncharacterised function (DUF1905) [Acholeplasma oculi]|uniref:Uncharacterized protein n=1 Tax=Acholeplasma oculi TaxID=35623 RepID=A0A061A9Q4_9MOLU|nr:DUF1905 domain-containing protein [Acholeplasma oculi]CDR30129.1 hypothetical protein, DUF1905 [Acholeplasma oculi]SKC44616.1 protein of unknown function [Acholeplasma oculi]SUT88429.1 Domain of uncharacterised function (DUF1905) [Acholeplasma oculi]
MKKLLDHQKLTLIYQPGFGSWTYHLVIPKTASIKGTWGSLRVIGKIDDYILHEHNLAPRKDEDKIISINKKIRSTINKSGGDLVTVTLYLLEWFDTEEEISKVFETIML